MLRSSILIRPLKPAQKLPLCTRAILTPSLLGMEDIACPGGYNHICAPEVWCHAISHELPLLTHTLQPAHQQLQAASFVHWQQSSPRCIVVSSLDKGWCGS